jgi:ABC-2 type transport system permease protein
LQTSAKSERRATLFGDAALLLRPRVLPVLRRGLSRNTRGGGIRLWALSVVGAAFWLGLFALAFRVLHYFQGIEDIGDILAYKLLSMILIVCFALLVFSSILTSLSTLYLSRDLLLVHSMPVASHRIVFARWIDSTVDSAWMVLVFTLPVFLAYGIVFGGGAVFYAGTLLILLLLAVTASAGSALAVMCGVMVVPAGRMRHIVVLLGVLLFVMLYLAIRLLRPEQLVNPEVFDSVLIYLSSLQAPASPWLPSTWAYEGIQGALTGSLGTCAFNTGLAASFAVALICILLLAADHLYCKGFSRTQAAPLRQMHSRGVAQRLFGFLPGPVRAFTVKEITTFLRDQTQWSQLLLIAALVVIYIYNFDVLPLDRSPIKTVYLQNLFAFLNMGLALFVLTAVTARFVYPAVSLEKEAFWLVQTSPLPLRTFLRIKFCIYYLPLLILTETLIVGSNLLLHVTPFMMALSTATVFFLVPGIVAMGIGLGAAYPDFKAENPAQTATSFGGLLFMVASAAVIGAVILLEAGPVYRLFMAGLHGKPVSPAVWAWTAVSFGLALGLSLLAILLPLRLGERRLSRIHL